MIDLVFPPDVVAYCNRHYGYSLEDMRTRFNGRAEQTIGEILPELMGMQGKYLSMMDIGCGIGGTTAALASVLGMKAVHLVEADEERVPLEHGYNQSLEPWNNVRIAKLLVEVNLPDDVAVYGHDSRALLAIGQHTIPPLDLIVSFRSWCHHYPASVYLNMVKRLLKPWSGRLVVDVRTNTTNMRMLEGAGFEKLAYVSQASASIKKTGRYVFRHKG